MTAKELKSRAFRVALSESIRRKVRTASHDAKLPDKSGFTIALLRLIAAVLSLVLAGGAVSLDQETSATQKRAELKQPSGYERTDQMDTAAASLDSELNLAEELRLMVLNRFSIPVPASVLVGQYVESQMRDTILVHDQTTPVIIQNPPPAASPTSIPAPNTTVIVNSVPDGEGDITKQFTPIIQNLGNQLTVLSQTSATISKASGDLETTLQKTPDCCLIQNSVVNDLGGSHTAASADKHPSPFESSAVPVPTEYDVEVPGSGWSNCISIVASGDKGKNSKYVRFSHAKTAKKPALVVQSCDPNNPDKPGDLDLDVPTRLWSSFIMTARSARATKWILFSTTHYFVQVFPVDPGGSALTNGQTLPKLQAVTDKQ